MSMVKKLHKKFVEILCAVNCLIVGMSVLFIALLSVVVLPKGLRRKTLTPLGFSESEKKNVKRKVDIPLTGEKVTGALLVDAMSNYQKTIDGYVDKIEKDMDLAEQRIGESEKKVLLAERIHVLTTQYKRYLDPAREDLHLSAQTIMAICEEIGTDDFVSVSGGYRVVITKDMRNE